MEAATLSALGEPSRFKIVELLRTGPMSVGDIAASLAIRQPQVSKHLRVLSESGIVSRERLARHRIYHLEPAPFEEIGRWVDSFERLWEVRLDSLGRYLATMDTPGDDPAEKPRSSR